MWGHKTALEYDFILIRFPDFTCLPRLIMIRLIKTNEILLAPMGVLAPVSAHAGHSAQPPIGTSRNFPAHVSAESPSNISPKPLRSLYWIFLILANFLVKLGLIGGEMGSPNFFLIGIFQFVLLGSPCKNL